MAVETVEREWQRLRQVAILLSVLSLCLYLPTLFHELFADDEIYLGFTNAMLRRSSWSELYLFFLKPANPWEFLPVRDLTYWIDFRLFGDNPTGFHLSNLLCYGVSVCAAGWFFRELYLLSAPKDRQRAGVLTACGTAVFAMHPAHVEAVAWVASRKDLLAGSFALLSSAVLANGIRCGWAWRQIALSIFFLMLAVFSKAAGLTQVLFNSVIVLVFWRSGLSVSLLRRWCALLLPLAVACAAAAIHLQMGETTGIRIENSPGVFAVLERASRIVTSLSGILFFPYHLGLYHDVYRFGSWHWLTSCALLLLCLFALVRAMSSPPRLWMLGVLLMVTPWGVYLQLMPFSTWSLMGERFAFVSVAGLSLIVVDAFSQRVRPRMALGVLLALASLCGVLTWNRVADWEFGGSLRAREFERNPAFHGAIRDRVVYVLLPEKRYTEAEALASHVARDYARDVLLALIDIDRAFKRLGTRQSDGRSQEFQVFCLATDTLLQALAVGYARIRWEADVSYNNILRSVERQWKLRYADAMSRCGEQS